MHFLPTEFFLNGLSLFLTLNLDNPLCVSRPNKKIAHLPLFNYNDVKGDKKKPIISKHSHSQISNLM
jgi:hypothetical protein